MASSPQLHSSLLISAARSIALEVAANRDLYLSPDALPAVDTLVEERMPELNRMAQEGRFEFRRWQAHVRSVSEKAADQYRAQRLKQITEQQEVLRTVRSILAVYPYDLM